MHEDPIIKLIAEGHYPEVLEISEQVDEGYNPSFNKTASRLYLRKGNKAVIVPKGFEWFAMNYYNLKKMVEQIPIKIFISYPREDLWLAYKLHKMLSEVGVPVYLGELYPEPGMSLWTQIELMIRNSDIFIILWTQNALNSAFVNQEIGVAKNAGKIIIPIVEEGVELKDALEGKAYICLNKDDVQKTLSSICSALHDFLSQKLEEIKKKRSQGLAFALGAIAFLGLLFALGNKG